MVCVTRQILVLCTHPLYIFYFDTYLFTLSASPVMKVTMNIRLIYYEIQDLETTYTDY